jgi:hypothetical protein
MSVSFRLFVDGDTEICYTQGSLRATSQIGERGTANASLKIAGPKPFDTGDIVTITRADGTTVIWVGVIDKVNQKVLLDQLQTSDYTLTLVSIEAWASRRRYSEAFTDIELDDLITDIIATSLTDLGISVGTVADVGEIPEFKAQLESVDDILRRICDKYGLIWYIDPATLTLNIVERDAVSAPFDIIENEAGGTWFSMSVDEETGGYFNRIHVAGWSVTDPRTEELTGDGVKRTFTVSLPVATKPTVEVNSVPKTVGINGLDTGKDWYWNKGQAEITQDTSGTLLGASREVPNSENVYEFAVAGVGNLANPAQAIGNNLQVIREGESIAFVSVNIGARTLNIRLYQRSGNSLIGRGTHQITFDVNDVLSNTGAVFVSGLIVFQYGKWDGSAVRSTLHVLQIATGGMTFVGDIDLQAKSGFLTPSGGVTAVQVWPDSVLAGGVFMMGFSHSGSYKFHLIQMDTASIDAEIVTTYDTGYTVGSIPYCDGENIAIKVEDTTNRIVVATFDSATNTVGDVVTLTSWTNVVNADLPTFQGFAWMGDYLVAGSFFTPYISHPLSVFLYDKTTPALVLKDQLSQGVLGMPSVSGHIEARGTRLYLGRGTTWDGSEQVDTAFVVYELDLSTEALVEKARVEGEPFSPPPTDLYFELLYYADGIVAKVVFDTVTFDHFVQAWSEVISFGTDTVTGDVLSVTYRGLFRDLHTGESADEISTRAAQSGGSGIYETGATLGHDKAGEMVDYATAQLQRYAQFMRRIRYSTRTDGLLPGQLQTISLPAHNIEGVFLIERITHQHQAGSLHFTQVEGVIGGDLASWQNYFRQLTGAGQGLDLGAGDSVIIPVGPPNEVVLLTEVIAADEVDPDPVIGEFVIGLDEIQGEE